MKRTLLLICTLLCAIVLFAQEQLAVLKHNDSTRVFYGQTAFEQAYSAATHGDIITLSDGVFTAPSQINKGITVRGNGAVADTARRSSGTYFMESFYVYQLGDSLQFSAEGIYFDYFSASNSLGIKLVKCFINRIGVVQDAQITNCIIIEGQINPLEESNNTFTNCIIKNAYKPYSSSNTNRYLPTYSICTNCILIGREYGGSSHLGTYNNCIIIYTNQTRLDGVAHNSVLIGFTGCDNPASSGNVAMSLSDVFENWDGESLSTDLETYVLKSSVSDSIQGLDGTEVGIFGGFMPFEWRPSYSIIKRFNVANRTTADGKLSVDIEVISE
ncbi:MAG: hypothetical protein U0L65_01080 [Bacteroidales bacterium]|nr:hypothetical protein [Bacteroidales bacterium]